MNPLTTHNAAAATAVNLPPDSAQLALKYRRQRLLLGLVGAGLLLVGADLGWRWWHFQATHIATTNAQVKGHLSPISARITATVKAVQVNDGDYVQAGQPLVLLENPDLDLQVTQAEANLKAVQATLRSATDTVKVTRQMIPAQIQQVESTLTARRAALDTAEAQLHQAQAQVDSNRARVKEAQTLVGTTLNDLHRYQLLYNQGAISTQQLDSARVVYDHAQASLVMAQQALVQAQVAVKSGQAQVQNARADVVVAQGQVAEKYASAQMIGVQQDQQRQSQAQVEQAQAALALARQQVANYLIKAPIAGYVGRLTAQVGEKIQPGQALLALVPLQTDQVYIEANFKETVLGRLQVGQQAQIRVDAYPQDSFLARVSGLSPATGSSFALIPPDNATGNFNKVVQWLPVRLMLLPGADPQHKLRPGLSVRVTVDTGSQTPL